MDDSSDRNLPHELNTALSVLRLRVQMLQRRSRSDERVREPLAGILASLDGVQGVCARVLARLGEDGGTVTEPGPGRAADEELGIAEPLRVPHVAVVNDDTTFLRLMRELLGMEEGYKVSTSFVGSEGYGFVRDLQPDLVVLDLVFGDSAEEGWRTLDLLTLDPATRRIPVIVCSAATVQLQDHADWLSRFDVRVLPKPFDLDVLLAIVREALDDPREGRRREPV
jgi:CheY-like chemotaxis protein